MRPPRFWYPEEGGDIGRVPIMARLLSPLGAIYHWAGRIRALTATPHDPGVPVICIGNLTAGGAGKTPLGLTVARLLTAGGRRPVFLTRGYGGRLKGPVAVDPAVHAAAEVGDEPLLLAEAAPTVVARDRAAGADLAVRLGADVIVMDDGFQNPSLRKTLSVLVVDGEVLFGNGQVIPAGPLRERLETGLARADGIVLMGGAASPRAEAFLTGLAKPHFEGRLVADADRLRALEGRPFVAFAGIGRPEKFFGTARASGLDVVATHAFPDHHMFTSVDFEALRRDAEARGATLLTTAKDAMRLSPAVRAGVEILSVTAELFPESAFAEFIMGALE